MKRTLISLCYLLLAVTGCKNIRNFHESDGKIDVTISSEAPARFHLQTAEKEQWLTTPFSFTVNESIGTYKFISVNPAQKLTMQVLKSGRKTIEVNASIITLDKSKGGLRGSGSGSN